MKVLESKLKIPMMLFVILMGAIILAGCLSTPTYKNQVAYPNAEEKIVFIVGVDEKSPNSLSYVRICTDGNEEDRKIVRGFTHHRLSTGQVVAPGEVFVIEQPNYFEERRLCAFSKYRYEDYIGAHMLSKIVRPGEYGPGLYYLGTLTLPDTYAGTMIEDIYKPDITDEIYKELKKVIKTYPDMEPKNFNVN